MENRQITMSENDLAYFAGQIVGKVFKWLFGCLIVVFLIVATVGNFAKASAPVEPVKVEQVKKKPAAKVKAKKAKRAKKACACKCPKPAKPAKVELEKITIEPQKVVDIEAKLN